MMLGMKISIMIDRFNQLISQSTRICDCITQQRLLYCCLV